MSVQTFGDTGWWLYYNGSTSVPEFDSNATWSPDPTGNWIDVFCSMVSPYDPTGKTEAKNPILYVSQSLFCENDFMTFGAVVSLSDPQKLAYGYGGGGVVVLGHGWQSSTDPPRINLNDSGYNTLYITDGSSQGSGGIQAVLANIYAANITLAGNLTAQGMIYNNVVLNTETSNRALNTIYQNTYGYNIIVYVGVIISAGSEGNGGVYIGASTSSMTGLFAYYTTAYSTFQCIPMTFIVPAGWYYEVKANSTSIVTIHNWVESNVS